MSFDIKDLEPLIAVLVSKGAPILGGILGGPPGAVIGGLVGQLATSFGLPADSPPITVAQTIAADPAASGKLSPISDNYLAVLQLQVDQNNTELQVDGPWGLKLFYGGWRPAMGWLSGFVMAAYAIVAAGFNLHFVPDSLVSTYFLPIFLTLVGARTYERATGVSLDSVLKPKVKS